MQRNWLLMSTVLAGMCLAVRGSAAEPLEAPPLPVLSGCFVTLVQEADVPAQEAGVIAELKVREGVEVHAGDLLVRIDDRRAEIDKRLAQFEYDGAREKADNDINVRYARAAADVAEAEYLASLEANKKVADSVTAAEIRKLKLEHRRAILQIEQSGLEQTVAKTSAQAAAAKVEQADDGVRRRKIISPIDGVVVELRRHLGEWVQPGEPVVHVVRPDRLRVEGFAKAETYTAAQFLGHNVTVEAEVSGGKHREFTGRVVFVSPLQQAGRDFRVWAEVDNQFEDGQWVLKPGQTATMKVQ